MRDENEKPTGIDRRHLLGGTAKVAALAGLTGAIGGAGSRQGRRESCRFLCCCDSVNKRLQILGRKSKLRGEQEVADWCASGTPTAPRGTSQCGQSADVVPEPRRGPCECS